VSAPGDRAGWVGPVLQPGELSRAVVAALRELNPELEVVDRGGYLRVLAPGPCRLSAASVARHAGARFRLPSDLESIMSSFKGRLHITADEARWELAPRAEPA
jgi:hypothetical protein